MKPSTRPRPIALHQIEIATPCHAAWENMAGDEQVRHCSLCQKNVYNLSAMTEADAVQLLQEREGKLCVRLYTRQDGTVITRDCAPEHQEASPWRRLIPIVAASWLALGSAASTAQPLVGHPLQGEPAPLMGAPAAVQPERLLTGKPVALIRQPQGRGSTSPNTRPEPSDTPPLPRKR